MAILCFGAAMLFWVQGVLAASPKPATQEVRQVLSVDVELVNITATVIDDSGKSIDGLTAEDFQVFEDGEPQQIAFFSHESTRSVSIGVLIDTSGSLQDKLRQGLQTVREIAASMSSADEMFVITFNSRVNLRQKFTNDPEALQRSLPDMHAKGETALYDAISAGLDEMQTSKNRKRILLLVTDGFDTGSKMKAYQAEDLLRRSEVALYAISIDDDDSHPPAHRAKYHIYNYMLDRLSAAGGGRLIRLYTGRNYDLHGLSEQLMRELHHEYTIGYYSTARPNGPNWKHIEVRVAKPGTHVASEKDNR
jgi:Ca-activated chloride channel homolog